MIDQILKILMFKRDKRVTQVAREADVPQQTLQRIVAGLSTRPHPKTLNSLATYFSVSIGQLTGKEPLPEETITARLSNAQNQSSHPIPYLDSTDVQAYLQHPDAALVKNHISADSALSTTAFAIAMTDSSMEPYIPKGATLILDPAHAPRDRGFVLASLEGFSLLMFRQILIDGEHRYLKAMNPDLAAFPMRLLKTDDRILGTLVELRHRYDH